MFRMVQICMHNKRTYWCTYPSIMCRKCVMCHDKVWRNINALQTKHINNINWKNAQKRWGEALTGKAKTSITKETKKSVLFCDGVVLLCCTSLGVQTKEHF